MSENSSSCIVTDGEISLSSKDHLEWNQKKHDMMLNLGLTNNNSETDQTPTPTRFIRNCEEVGLFQDLQNVNPFDEVFKKAVENPTSVLLQVPVSSSDDTLHTPQIYPQLEENLRVSNTTATVTSNNYSLNSVISSTKQEVDDGDNLTIVLEPENNQMLRSFEKHKANIPRIKISSKESCKDGTKQTVIDAIMQKTSGGITPIPIDKLIDHENQTPETEQTTVNLAELFRQREANKAAQSRCRKRKQREFEAMSAEIHNLRKENLRLTGMNLYLQETVKKLEAELKATKSSSSQEQRTSTTNPETLSNIVPTKSAESNQSKPMVASKQVTVSINPKKNNKRSLFAPNVKAIALPVQSALALPVKNSNNTLLVVCPGNMTPQNSVIVPTPILPKPVGLYLNSKIKTSYKRIVPKDST